MAPRYEKAHTDLLRWRNAQPLLLKDTEITPQIESIVRAVDAAFKSEVLEYRIRAALRSQALNEAQVAHVQPHETLTGMHRWDFDWWLTEATLRAVHAGIDAMAQLLNVIFQLGVDADDPELPREVVKKVAAKDGMTDISAAIDGMWNAPESVDLRALVNHLKHAGFPERGAKDVSDALSRATSIDAFTYKSVVYGPWTPSDIETMIDGFRRHAIELLEKSAVARRSS